MSNCKDCLILVGCFALLVFYIPFNIVNNDSDQFNDYLRKFNKTYNGTEYEKRLRIFKTSKETIERLNADRENGSAHFGLTKFSDLLPLEFLVSNLLNDRRNESDFTSWIAENKNSSFNKLPLHVDWREKGVISDMYNQRSCGACWAFTIVETIESMVAIKTGWMEKLSVQQIIDCSTRDSGCKGGDMCVSLEEIILNRVKIVKENVYPLTYETQNCKITNATEGIEIRNYKCEYLAHNEQLILSYLANHGPVNAAVNAKLWQNYLGGIIQYHCTNSPFDLNHATQIVGYDIRGPIPYYIVRNSWGEDFGENGYARVAVGKNICGIANRIVTIYV